jgi:hypothetical protein
VVHAIGRIIQNSSHAKDPDWTDRGNKRAGKKEPLPQGLAVHFASQKSEIEAPANNGQRGETCKKESEYYQSSADYF